MACDIRCDRFLEGGAQGTKVKTIKFRRIGFNVALVVGKVVEQFAEFLTTFFRDTSQ